MTKSQETYPLPHGKLVWKDQQPEFERDDEKLLSWLKANKRQDMVALKETVKWGDLKKTLTFQGDEAFDTETGEKVPGITVVNRDRVFTVGK